MGAAGRYRDDVVDGRLQRARCGRRGIYQAVGILAEAAHPSVALADLGDSEGLDGSAGSHQGSSPPVLPALRFPRRGELARLIGDGLAGACLIIGETLAAVRADIAHSR
jgi:hypothetical protein